jgi:hypothetical protein
LGNLLCYRSYGSYPRHRPRRRRTSPSPHLIVAAQVYIFFPALRRISSRSGRSSSSVRSCSRGSSYFIITARVRIFGGPVERRFADIFGSAEPIKIGRFLISSFLITPFLICFFFRSGRVTGVTEVTDSSGTGDEGGRLDYQASIIVTYYRFLLLLVILKKRTSRIYVIIISLV